MYLPYISQYFLGKCTVLTLNLPLTMYLPYISQYLGKYTVSTVL